MPHRLLLLFACGCLDYTVKPSEEGLGQRDTSGTTPLDTGGGEFSPCLEADTLADGTPVDESCFHEPASGTLDAVVEWSNDFSADYGRYGQVLMAPMVGELTDDDFDGDVDMDDIPDIVVVADDDGADGDDHHGVLRVVDGAGRGVHTTLASVTWGDWILYPYRYSNVALANVDGVGLPEVVFVAQLVSSGPDTPPDGGEDTAPPADGGGDDSGTPPEEVEVRPPPPTAPESEEGDTCYLAAMSPDGAVRWVATANGFGCGGHAPAVADLEGDGAAEVIIGAQVVKGADGTPYWAGSTGEGRYPAYQEVGYQSFALDLDGDGLQEVLAGRTVYEASGAVRCEIDAALDDGFPAAADLDLDGQGEFVLVGNGTAHVHDGDCQLLAIWPLVGAGNGGPPTIGDFDADGAPEIGIAEATTYSVYEVDGSVRWSMPTTDGSSHATGSAVFDFDGDGRAEVVYGDEVGLWIFDGATGAVRYHDDLHTSRTLHEYPVIADVDLDGNAEIVVPQGGGHHGSEQKGLYVLGSASGAWAADRPIWNQHAYSITNITDTLDVPAPGVPNWPAYNTFRSGDLSPLSGGDSADALGWGDVCSGPCVGGRIQVAVKVGNGGTAPLRGALSVSAYAETGAGLVYLDTLRTGDTLESGAASDVLLFDLDVDLVPDGVVVFRVDDDDGVQQVAECHEDNNELRVEGVTCR